MPWDSVEVGLAGGEETVNFGPRNESGSSLYQVDTLASVSPRGEVSLRFTIDRAQSSLLISLCTSYSMERGEQSCWLSCYANINTPIILNIISHPSDSKLKLNLD